MWLVIILTVLNAIMGHMASFAELRVTVAGLPINTIDGLMFLGLALSPFWLRRASEWGKHRLFAPLMVLCGVSWVGGTAMGLIEFSRNHIELRELITYSRNFVAIPIGIFIGYSALTRYKSMRTFTYVAALSGCVTATLIVRYFVGHAGEVGANKDINLLRTVDYVQAYAGAASGLFVASVLLGARMFPTLLTAALAAYCVVGNCASLSRSDWLTTVGMMAAIFTCLPREKMVLRGVQGLFAVVVVVIAVAIGIEGASRLTGTDFRGKMITRIHSLLPGEQEGVKHKAWDSRLYGAQREIEAGLGSPVIGRGFGIQNTPEMADAVAYGTRHNAWTNAFAETGLVGLITVSLIVGGCVVVGRRMVMARTDATTVLFGALALATGAYSGLLGAMTGSFNYQRAGIQLGLMLGLVLRARTMQLSVVREYAGYVDFGAAAADGEQLPLTPVEAAGDAYY